MPLPVAVAAGLVLVLAAGTIAFWIVSRPAQHHRAPVALASGAGPSSAGQATSDAGFDHSPEATPTATPTASPAAAPPIAAQSQPSSAPPQAPVGQPPSGPGHFTTLGPGAALPSGAQCADWVRASAIAENKGVNQGANQVTGQHVGTDLMDGDTGAAQAMATRIDGQFTGTTHQILRWAACKWGIDEDIVAAQAAVESWWRQTELGDFGTDPTQCPPGHPLGADGTAGQCPQSYGILQNRFPYERSTWPGIANSTAMNADAAYAIWRTCFEGYEQWLNTVDQGSQYGAGDAWGCVGRWFSGRWHTSASDGYMQKVQGYLNQRIWETASFQEP